jgi:hypothetical protein
MPSQGNFAAKLQNLKVGPGLGKGKHIAKIPEVEPSTSGNSIPRSMASRSTT